MKSDNKQGAPMLVNRGRAVEAIYRKPEIPDYEGNPLLEALPPMLTTEQAMVRLAYYPKYDELQRKEQDHIRYLRIQNGMRFFAPLDVHIDLERRFGCLMRVGYAGRNPLVIGYQNWIQHKLDSLGHGDQYGEYELEQNQPSSTAAGFNIVGMSGVGKSRSVLRILNLYPQVIRHSQYRGKNFTESQLTWLKLECPFDGNTKGLCIQFFKAVDSILGTNYRRSFGRDYRIQDAMLSDMSTVAANHFLGVLVIDEIQRLSLAKSGGAEKMLNFFVELVNEIGVPVVLIGTHKALSVLSGEFSQMRRGTGQGDMIWNRMVKDDQWQLFVESLWRFQYTRKECPLNGKPNLRKKLDMKDIPSLSDVLYDETQGITDLAVKVYMFAQERAIDSGKEVVTAKIIQSAAKDKLRIPREVLYALKTGDKAALERFEDVYPKNFESYLNQLPEEVEVVGSFQYSPAIQALLKKHYQNIKGLQPPTELASQLTQDAVLSEADVQSKPSNTEAKSREHTRKNKKAESASVKGELSNIVATLNSKNGVSAYEALRHAGYMRPASEYL
jgi:hypothetical protein